MSDQCHPACAHNCAECFRARSESVGAEWEPQPITLREVLLDLLFWWRS